MSRQSFGRTGQGFQAGREVAVKLSMRHTQSPPELICGSGPCFSWLPAEKEGGV